MEKFELVSEYKPQGDQPQAIRELVSGIEQGQQHQTLLGGDWQRQDFYHGQCDSRIADADADYVA